MILVLSAVPFALIYKQPDLGTALVLGAILIAVLLVAGAKPRHLALIGVIGVLGVTAVLHFGVLHQYQKERLTAFLDPATNTQASAYNLDQSKIAIGSGRVEGKGLFRGTQTNLSYVPEQHTDFIFTAVGEQLGLVGSGPAAQPVRAHGVADLADREPDPGPGRRPDLRRRPGHDRLPGLRERRV